MSILLLTMYDGGSGDQAPEEIQAVTGTVEIWGTLPQDVVTQNLISFAKQDSQFERIQYQYFAPEDFDSELTEALADGAGPDMILVSHERLADQRKRIQPISYETLPWRDIKDTYLDGAHVYALSDGLYAFPMFVDPLLMFWNRDILSNANLLAPPATWEELVNSHFPKLIDREFDRTINQSVVAMGEYRNVRNSYGILSTLIIQGGGEGVVDIGDGKYDVRLNPVQDDAIGGPVNSAINFYVGFGDPSNARYSWNRSFREDRQQFLGEDLVYYFGYGSEALELEELNPNLNFDIAAMPQSGAATVRRTYGRIYGLSVLRSSDNAGSAFATLSLLSQSAFQQSMANALVMAPAQRSLVSGGANGNYGRLIYSAAPVTFGWLNPAPTETDEAFSTAVTNVNENRRTTAGATLDLLSTIKDLYK